MIWVENVLVSSGEGGVYGERLLKEFRVWDPYRSKLAAYYYLGGEFELTPDLVVLYLGAANGTTVSHVADYVGTVYAVEFAPRPMQDLVAVARRRNNVVPLMADAAAAGSLRPPCRGCRPHLPGYRTAGTGDHCNTEQHVHQGMWPDADYAENKEH